MQPHRRSEAGETLIEVLVSILLLGAISAAYFFAFIAQTKASTSNKSLVTADSVTRQYAEYAKSAVRNQCNKTNAGSTVVVGYTSPNNYGVSTTPSPITCPDLSTAQPPVKITVTGPQTIKEVLYIQLRTP